MTSTTELSPTTPSPLPPAPDESAGDRRLAALYCGNYGEDELVAWRMSEERRGLVVLVLRSGPRWWIEPTCTLEVEAKTWSAKNYISINTTLWLRSETSRIAITHFELDIMWGGTNDDDVAAFAHKVAAEIGCSVLIHEMQHEGS